ncbi:lipopolysaccharide biosynthesis protein [Sphingobacterium sp. UGAL515B_05]|uniref:lipopolysaccharide biosynthesis protein n=1 Tax=Sphingobacterium sp. UGAL515B_05 TaxID=2986767 RepID=UPI002953E391|nr:lipopolysaccharide biosynthesis protein [Sphingobacterium sp. UGAL515B_05]WON96067.1 lipopolysaccharide biosynthesis protein [Sphingobacterium sp. UGAL515B_05]
MPSNRLYQAFFFTAIAKYANLVISLGVTAVLARLLSPEQFGVIAVAMVIIAFLNLIADIGLFPAVIQYKNLTKDELGNLFSISCYLGFILALILVLIAPLIAGYYGQPLLRNIIRLLAIGLFFTASSVVPNALFYRERMFKFIAIRSFIIQIVLGAVSISAAFYGAGIYALLINPILYSILLFIVSYVHFPLPFKLRISLNTIRPILRYSTFQFLFNIVNYFSKNSDTLLIGRYLGINILGYYDKAYQLMSLPLQNITQVITPVIHPILSLKKEDKMQLIAATEQLIAILALIGFPLASFLYFAAEDLIYLFFGAQWGTAVPVFQILSLTVGIQLILSSSGSIFQTTGDTKYMFLSGLLSALLNVCGILLGIFYFEAISAVAVCLVISNCITFVFTYAIMYTKVFYRNFLCFFYLLAKPVMAGLFLTFLLYMCGIFLRTEIVWYKLFVKIVVSSIFFIAFVWFAGYRSYIALYLKRNN